jgi:hypothetical protein
VTTTARDRFVSFLPSRVPIDLRAAVRDTDELEELTLVTPMVLVPSIIRALATTTQLRTLALGESWLERDVLDAVINSPAPLQTLRINLRHATAPQAARLADRTGLSRLIAVEPTAAAMEGLNEVLCARRGPPDLTIVRPVGAQAIEAADQLTQRAPERTRLRVLAAHAIPLHDPRAPKDLVVGHDLVWSLGVNPVARVIVDSCAIDLPVLPRVALRASAVYIDSLLLRPAGLDHWLRQLPCVRELTLPATYVGSALHCPPGVRVLRIVGHPWDHTYCASGWAAFFSGAPSMRVELIGLQISRELAVVLDRASHLRVTTALCRFGRGAQRILRRTASRPA